MPNNDQHPVVVGGIGGSGTRLVAGCLMELEFFLGHNLNRSIDNLWFTLLFKRREILKCSDQEFDDLVEIFVRATAGHGKFVRRLIRLLDGLAMLDRRNGLTSWLRKRAGRLLSEEPGLQLTERWGWKEPNSHVVLGRLVQRFSQMKYIHVTRNGLDMAHSRNQQQLRLWGRHFVGDECKNSQHCSLKYWCAVHRRVLDIGSAMGRRFLFLNYDDFCRNPDEGVLTLCDFLGVKSSDHRRERLTGLVKPQPSAGRFRQYGTDIFDAQDVAYVRSLGFDVDDEERS